MESSKTIVAEARVGLTTLAELMVFYQKKRGHAFRTRSEAISFILETQLAQLKMRGEIRELTEDEAMLYLGITIGGRGLLNRRKAAAAIASETFASESGFTTKAMDNADAIRKEAVDALLKEVSSNNSR